MRNMDAIKARLGMATTELRVDDWQHDMRRLIARVEALEKVAEAAKNLNRYQTYTNEQETLKDALAELEAMEK